MELKNITYEHFITFMGDSNYSESYFKWLSEPVHNSKGELVLPSTFESEFRFFKLVAEHPGSKGIIRLLSMGYDVFEIKTMNYDNS